MGAARRPRPRPLVTYAAAAAAVAWLADLAPLRQDPEHPRLAAIEAALVAAAIGGWLAAAVTWGPLGWPAAPADLDLHCRVHRRVLVAAPPRGRPRGPPRREEAAEWSGPQSLMARIAHLIGLGDFHLQEITPTRLGEELLLTSAPGSRAGQPGPGPARAIAENLAHLLGLRYGRIELRGTEYPGQLVISIREQAPTVDGPVTHPALDPDSPYADWFARAPLASATRSRSG